MVIFAEAKALERTKWLQILQPVVLPELQGNGTRAQRSISAGLIFWFFCIKTKEQSLSGY
jgi:hypothetical protein